LTVFGNLTIAGETRPIEMNVDLQPISGAGERATGKVDIKMKEYGIKPPSLLFGSLKVANEVTVNFNSVVQPSSEAQ
jgi:polyisoprenoid-binding protein YceI